MMGGAELVINTRTLYIKGRVDSAGTANVEVLYNFKHDPASDISLTTLAFTSQTYETKAIDITSIVSNVTDLNNFCVHFYIAGTSTANCYITYAYIIAGFNTPPQTLVVTTFSGDWNMWTHNGTSPWLDADDGDPNSIYGYGPPYGLRDAYYDFQNWT